MSAKKRPVNTIKVGSIKAAIWENETDNGTRFNTTYCEVYRLPKAKRNGDADNGYRETDSIGRDANLFLAKAADLAHTWILSQESSVTS